MKKIFGERMCSSPWAVPDPPADSASISVLAAGGGREGLTSLAARGREGLTFIRLSPFVVLLEWTETLN